MDIVHYTNSLQTLLHGYSKLNIFSNFFPDLYHAPLPITVTEDEIYHGILAVPSPNSHCLCYTRNLIGLHDNLTDTMATKHIDVEPCNPTTVDINAQKLLNNVKEEKLPQVLCASNIHHYSIPWTPGGVNPTVTEHEVYLQEFCTQVCADIKRLVDEALIERDECTSELFQEVLHHATFCDRKCDSFCGRTNILNRIEQHITSSSQRPLVVYGPSGSGKTSVMAKAAHVVQQWMRDKCSLVMILRFLGTSPSSSSIRSVLESVCAQICMIFQFPQPNFQRMDYIQVVQYFQGQLLESLPLTEKNEHLVIFLDSIDQLSSSNGAYTLNWLPKFLPPNVHIIVSMLPQEHGCLQTIRTMLPLKECYVEVDAMPLQTGMEILEAWLGKIGRRLTHEQERVVSTIFSMQPQPLFLRLLFRTVRHWKSYTPIDKMIVANSTTEALSHFYEYLEENYGRILVQRALGYITAGGNGLTEAELEDVLSLDDEVLNDVYQYWDPPVEGVVRIPVLLWKRIRHNIDDYLVQQHADGKTVLAWYHRQFVESARARYVEKDESTKQTLHLTLSTFFEGTWSGNKGKTVTLSHRMLTIEDAKRQVASQPLQYSDEVYNLRKLNELPLHLLLSKQQEKLKRIALCNFEWLHTKLKATDFTSLMSDFSLPLSIIEDKDISITNETLLLSAHSLKVNPDSLAGQLLGRLNSLESSLSPYIQNLLSQVHKWIENCEKSLLIPNNTCLISPGGPLKTTLSGHPQLVLGLSISKTHPFAVSCSKGSNCSIFNVWNVKTFQYVQNLHTLKIADVGLPCFALNGELLTAISGKTLSVWNCNTGEEISSTSFTNDLASVAVTTDNQLIVAGTKTGAVVALFKGLDNFDVITETHKSCIKYIGFVDNDRLCVTVTDSGEMSVIDITTKKLIHVMQLHTLAIACLHTAVSHSDVPLAFTGSEDKTAKVVNLKNGNVEHTFVGHTKTVKCLITLPNSSKFLVTGSLDKMLKVWDISSGKCIRTITGHLDGVWCVAAMPDGRTVVSGSKDDYLKVWDIEIGTCLHTLEGHSSWVSCVAVTHDSNDVVLSGSNDKMLKVWKLAKQEAPPTDRHYMQPECIISTSTGLVVSGAPDATKVWDITNGNCIHTFDAPSSSLALTTGDNLLISGAKNGIIRIWDLTSFSLVSTLEGHTETVTFVSPLNKHAILSASMDSTLKMWDTNSGECVALNGHSGGIKCVVVSKNKHLVISGSFDCSVRVWDTESPECMATLNGHTKVVWCVALNSTDTEVASGGDDSIINLWSMYCLLCLYNIQKK